MIIWSLQSEKFIRREVCVIFMPTERQQRAKKGEDLKLCIMWMTSKSQVITEPNK